MPKSRVWRLRRSNGQIDAEIREAGEGTEIRLLLNGELIYRHQCASREQAIAEAAEKRAELERHGWTEHW